MPVQRQSSFYTPQTTWWKIKKPAYTQAEGRDDLFERQWSG